MKGTKLISGYILLNLTAAKLMGYAVLNYWVCSTIFVY